MKLFDSQSDCCGCAACAACCPVRAITMAPDSEGFAYPHVDQELCVDCGRCRDVCPVCQPGDGSSSSFFAARAKDENLRASGSSGGIFSLLSGYVLDRGGAVFGAAFQDSFRRVAHVCAQEQRQLERLKCTKYVQSDLGDSHAQVKALLDAGRWVLFCGTPCQTRSLQRYLGEDSPRLVTLDLVCYGVPSPGLWGDYVRYLESRHGGRLAGFAFRDKRNGDNGHTLSFTVEGKGETVRPLGADPYCQAYFWNYSIRPACHACRFCTPRRTSDFTLGDFWGIERVEPELDDGLGNSLVILHTQKARDIWQALAGKVTAVPCGEAQAVQPRLSAPTPSARYRNLFQWARRTLPFSLFIRLGPLWGLLRKSAVREDKKNA